MIRFETIHSVLSFHFLHHVKYCRQKIMKLSHKFDYHILPDCILRWLAVAGAISVDGIFQKAIDINGSGSGRCLRTPLSLHFFEINGFRADLNVVLFDLHSVLGFYSCTARQPLSSTSVTFGDCRMHST